MFIQFEIESFGSRTVLSLVLFFLFLIFFLSGGPPHAWKITLSHHMNGVENTQVTYLLFIVILHIVYFALVCVQAVDHTQRDFSPPALCHVRTTIQPKKNLDATDS